MKDSTQFWENVRSGKGISAPKEQAKKRKAPEEKNAPNNKIHSKYGAEIENTQFVSIQHIPYLEHFA